MRQDQNEQASPPSTDRLVELAARTIHRNGFDYEVTLVSKIDRFAWSSMPASAKRDWVNRELKEKMAQLEEENRGKQNSFESLSEVEA